MKTDRRSFLRGIGAALLATTIPAPAIAGSIFEATHPFWKARGILPRGWIPCDGRELPVAMFQELFDVIGDTYGRTSEHTFRIPDLRGFSSDSIEYRVASGADQIIPTGSVHAFLRPTP